MAERLEINDALARELSDLHRRVRELERSHGKQETKGRARRAKSKLRALLDAVPDMMLRQARDGTFLEYKPAHDFPSVVPPSELLGKRPHEVLPQQVAEHSVRAIERALETGRLQTLEYELPVNGDTHYFEARIVANGADEVVAFIRDVTEQRRSEEQRKHLEHQLLRAQKMEALGTLAGGVAHDFNNILQAIVGYAELVEMDLPSDSPARDSLTQLQAATKRAEGLVRQILAFSRKAEQPRASVSIDGLVRDALGLLRATLPSTIEIRHHLRRDAGMVDVYTSQIHQVLLNLGSNAAHAMRERGGVLEIAVDPVDVATRIPLVLGQIAPGRYAKLTVRDTGHGMDRATLDRIFDPFFTTKELGEGTGLGLSVVHGIIGSHGGTINVESEVGKGTTFEIYLPRAEAGESSGARVEGEDRQSLQRVLFVDDEEGLSQIGRRQLERFGYRVTTVTSSSEAWRLFRADPDRFDAVVTDQTMPLMTGLELAGKIRQLRPGLPIVLTTGFSDAVTPESAARAGVGAVLLKPYGGADLAQAIREGLQPREH